jgi:hypothetical protein
MALVRSFDSDPRFANELTDLAGPDTGDEDEPTTGEPGGRKLKNRSSYASDCKEH